MLGVGVPAALLQAVAQRGSSDAMAAQALVDTLLHLGARLAVLDCVWHHRSLRTSVTLNRVTSSQNGAGHVPLA